MFLKHGNPLRQMGLLQCTARQLEKDPATLACALRAGHFWDAFAVFATGVLPPAIAAGVLYPLAAWAAGGGGGGGGG